MIRLTKNTFLLFTLLLFHVTIIGQHYDMLLLNGHLIDPKNGINEQMDVAIDQGIIVSIENDLSGATADKIIDAQDLLVVPGLIDIHVHVFHGTKPHRYLSDSYGSVAPDGFTLESGVTTVVDAGGAGWRNFRTFKEQTIDRSITRVLAFLNIVGHGMAGGAYEQDLYDMDPRLTSMVANQFKSDIVGIKLAHFSGPDWVPTQYSVEAATHSGLPVMIDFGGSQPPLSLDTLLLQELNPGDIFTHAYANVNGRIPIVDADGNVLPEVFKAQEKGIVFDVGHGGGSFVFEIAVPATKQGIFPTTISTDLHTGSMNGGMKDMTNVMSKFLALKMPLTDVIAASTWLPAKVIQKTELGHLSTGAIADITLLKLEKGKFGFVDTKKKKLTGNQKLICELTIKDGKIVYDLNGLSSEDWDIDE